MTRQARLASKTSEHNNWIKFFISLQVIIAVLSATCLVDGCTPPSQPARRSIFKPTKVFAKMNQVLMTHIAKSAMGRSTLKRSFHRDCKSMAFVTRSLQAKVPKEKLMARQSLHYCQRPLVLFHQCSRTSLTSQRIALKMSSSDNYYTAATSMSTFSTTPSTATPPDNSYPKWWPINSDHSIEKYITFADHIAHVIVPNATEKEEPDADDTPTNQILTCEDVIQWVLQARLDRGDKDKQTISNSIKQETLFDNSDHNSRRARIQAEYSEGQSVSTKFKILDPAFRHNPVELTQDITYGQPNLIAAELLALGSVWYLPYSTTKANVDRFDPSNGIKPTRLNLGDCNTTVHAGDYFRVHFEPRRFVDTNKFDWASPNGVIAGTTSADGSRDSIANENAGKPGVIVARDDEAGYLIISKPPNIPAHARVDNLLENVASSVGRALWLERRDSIVSAERSDESANSDANDAEPIVVDTTNSSSIEAKIAIARRRKQKNRKQKSEPLVYVATPQRLDQNTSGLLVVASKKSFASYFAKLLRTKTSGRLAQQESLADTTSTSLRSSSCGVHKTYKCLVAISPQNEPGQVGTTSSMASEIDRLKKYTSTMMKHFLEPSIRSPKTFVRSVPNDADNADSYAECLLIITNVTEVCTVVGNAPSEGLARALWGDYGKPNECIAVAECEIELLTGRTHQIRGQLAAEGFPLVGDVQYGGAVPNTSTLYQERCKGRAESFLDSESLCLQCCSLEFLDPDHTVKSDGSDSVKRSERWKSFSLNKAFWTSSVRKYHDESAQLASSDATSLLDVEAMLLKQMDPINRGQQPDKTVIAQLPPRVVLSKGVNKYVIIRAEQTDKSVDELWFVRSASPEECGGPYHANVAQSLLQQLESMGYTTICMGGGRIDFVENDEVTHAHVYGFSYGYGKGNHEKVASIIEEHTNVIATFDNSDGLY